MKYGKFVAFPPSFVKFREEEGLATSADHAKRAAIPTPASEAEAEVQDAIQVNIFVTFFKKKFVFVKSYLRRSADPFEFVDAFEDFDIGPLETKDIEGPRAGITAYFSRFFVGD